MNVNDRKLANANTEKAGVAAMVALASVGTFVILLSLLHVIKSELDPSWHFISEYEIGQHGWIMQLAFLALSLGNIALFVAIRNYMNGVLGGLGSVLFMVGTVGTVIGGIFITDPINTAPEAVSMNGKLHNLGGSLGLAGFVGTLIFSAKLLRAEAFSPARRAISLATAILILGFLVAFISIVTIAAQHNGVFGPDTPVGWPNRLGILAGCVWLAIVSWQAKRVATAACAETVQTPL